MLTMDFYIETDSSSTRREPCMCLTSQLHLSFWISSFNILRSIIFFYSISGIRLINCEDEKNFHSWRPKYWLQNRFELEWVSWMDKRAGRNWNVNCSFFFAYFSWSGLIENLFSCEIFSLRFSTFDALIWIGKRFFSVSLII